MVVFFSFDADTAVHGKRLWHKNVDNDLLLYEIKDHYKTQKSIEELASELLDGKLPGGGAGVISNSIFNGKIINWPYISGVVIDEWLRIDRENCYGSVLLSALRKSDPAAADEFEDWLLEEEEDGEKLFWKIFIHH